MNKLLDQIKAVEHGFKHIIAAGDSLLANKSSDHLSLAVKYLEDESYQVRMLATYLLGQLSVSDGAALKLLESKVAADNNWRVQEMLAKAFDYYCQAKGYEASLPKIKKWLSHKNPSVRRAVVEGLRIWTARPFFNQNPELAVELIGELRNKAGESDYLLKSVGNALRDIRKKYRSLVDKETAGWDLRSVTISHIKKIIDQ